MQNHTLIAGVSQAVFAIFGMFASVADAAIGDGQNVPAFADPDICDIGHGMGDGECPSGLLADLYNPRHCPEVLDFPPSFQPDEYIQLCRAPEVAPIPKIYCTQESAGGYVCEGSPLSLDDSLDYSWSSSAGLIVTLPATATDKSVVNVDCARTRSSLPSARHLTLTVITSDGVSASVTGPLNCPG